ncbi:HPt (histidine-containing phosphotransfer) domain-containing protein [Polaribacter sp. Hel1_33_78]|nr:HPt (histidine-containing phosphotransfer) domain-containing protein [Polaribacter sp. Hel1_33_78]
MQKKMEFKTKIKSDIVDLSSITKFFLKDKGFLIKLISVYLKDTVPRIEILEKSLTKIDYSAIKDISHFLKSSFALMGIRCLNEIIELENLAKIEASESSIKEKLNYIIPISKESTVEYERILGDLKKLEP